MKKTIFAFTVLAAVALSGCSTGKSLHAGDAGVKESRGVVTDVKLTRPGETLAGTAATVAVVKSASPELLLATAALGFVEGSSRPTRMDLTWLDDEEGSEKTLTLYARSYRVVPEFGDRVKVLQDEDGNITYFVDHYGYNK